MLGLQPGGLALGVLEGRQPRLRRAAVRHHGRQVLAVLSPQLRQQPPPLLHVPQASRVVLPPFELVAQRSSHVGELDGGRGQALAVGVERLAAGEPAGGAAQPVEHAALVRARVHQLHRREGGLAIRPGIGQTVLLETERRLLFGVLEVGGLDLGHLVAQDVGLACPLLVVAARARRAPRRARGSGCAGRARG